MILVNPSFEILTNTNLLKGAKALSYEHTFITVEFICSIGVAREFLGLPAASIECDFEPEIRENQLVFVIPSLSNIQPGEGTQSEFGLQSLQDVWLLNAMQNCEELYRQALNGGTYDPANVLIQAVKTECTISASVQGWKEVFSSIKPFFKGVKQSESTLKVLGRELSFRLPKIF